MTQNRLSTHGPKLVGQHACDYKHCDKSFSTPQGLAMHIGRVHTKSIPTASSKAVSKGLKAARNGENHKGKLTPDQKAVLVQFLAEKRGKFPTKVAAFTAALDHAGATGVVTANSTTVERYCRKAARFEAPPKCKYTKRAAQMPVVVPSAECVLTGPGMRIEFAAALMPTILHTIALAIGGKK